MPTNTAIPTVATGNVIAAATQNEIAVLNSAFGMFNATGTPLYGTIPPVTAPNFYMQFGVAAGTTDGSGNLTITFPTTFPNCVMAIIPTPTYASAGTHVYSFAILPSSVLAGAITAHFYDLTTTAASLASVAVSIPYIVIGA